MVSPAAELYRATRLVMGTVASLHIADRVAPDILAAATAAVFAELERLEQVFSTFRQSSDISRINRGELAIGDASSEVAEILDACTWLSHASNEAFSVTPPERPDTIDPAGFVKGWATERAARLLTENGLVNWYLGVGGDIQTSGRPTPERRWIVAIADPQQPGAVRATIELPDGYAIATSGTAERGQHLWTAASGDDPLVAVTVTGPSLTWADAFATTAFAMGRAGLAWVTQFDGYQAWAITAAGVWLGEAH